MKIKFQTLTTFQKLSLAFFLLGILPMVLICLLFMSRYEDSNMLTVQANMKEAGFYAQVKISEQIEGVDRAAEILYDYEAEPYSALYEILEDASLDKTSKERFISPLLRQILNSNPAVSAVYFITPDGEIFNSFYSQQKSLRSAHTEHHVLPSYSADNPRNMFLLPVENESLWCHGSEDDVITIARNYMDPRSVTSLSRISLGTLYIDLRTEKLGEMLSSLRLGETGNVLITNTRNNELIYSLYPQNGSALGVDSDFPANRYSLFTYPIGTDYLLTVAFDHQESLSMHTATRSYLLFILSIASLVILSLSLLFSGRISTPARELKRAMGQLRDGNLSVRADIHSGDEMEYLAEGFNQMVQELSDTIEEVYVAQICQRDAELNALKMQIQPHFLYNTLDIIRMSALEHEDAKTAKLIESLSGQLRYISDNHKEMVTLKEELDSLAEYAFLMETRYEGRINLKTEVADSLLRLYIPKLLLQPFVENAVKHGLKTKSDGGTILIEALEMGNELCIMIFNDGFPIEPERLEHIRSFLLNAEIGQHDENGIVGVGMKNTLDRIKLNCGKQYGFTLESSSSGGAVVTLKLPIRKEEKQQC
ncbi:MAG: sensor histidine kinase [Oscillospiraceae bacterium]|nr:sensor histidine kinase [Oscillospiraceae bacterium]